MKAIYDACRALLQAHQKKKLCIPHDLAMPLWAFERANRGHREKIDELASTGYDGKSRAERSPSDETRHRARLCTFLKSAWHLLRALEAADRNQLPQHELMDALWAAQDTTGFLAVLMRWHLNSAFRSAVPDESYLVACAAQYEGWGWNLNFTAFHRPRGLTAKRHVQLQSPALATLGSCRVLRHNYQQAMAKLVEDIDQWPEFGGGASMDQLRQSIRNQFEQQLRGLPWNQRQLIAQHWASMQPDCLRSK